jgi:hypothetical protein
MAVAHLTDPDDGHGFSREADRAWSAPIVPTSANDINDFAHHLDVIRTPRLGGTVLE